MRRKLKLLMKDLSRARARYYMEDRKAATSDYQRRSLACEKFHKEYNRIVEEFQNQNGVRINRPVRRINRSYDCVLKEIDSNIVLILQTTAHIPSRTLSRLAKAAKKKNQKFPLDNLYPRSKIPKDLRQVEFVK